MSNNSIAIINYGMGNLRSLEKAFIKIGAQVMVTDQRQAIESAGKIVLPGVGAFGEGMANLKRLDLIGPLNALILEKKKKILGICLGMQLFGEKSYEMEETPGLNWIRGTVNRLDAKTVKIPHVGWNNITMTNPSPLLNHIPDQTDFYFVHSYYFRADGRYVTSTANHGIEFAASVQKENIFGCQFHPEKSQDFGLEFLSNFVNLTDD